MSDIDFLRKIYIFNTLNEEEAKRILAITREVEFLDGETIMEEGAPGSTMYIITKGAVEISKTLTMALGKGEHEEREKVLTTLKAEDHVVFGEMALIGEEVRSASIFAKGYCKLLEIAKDDFWNLMNSRTVHPFV